MHHEELSSPLQRPRYGSIVDDERLSAEEMDERRRQNIAYEYLCHLEEAKRWMEVCLVEELPPTTELEEGLRNGVYLAKLAKFFAPKMVSEKKIYDVEQTRYKKSGLHFRHTDNTVQWLRAMESIGLPKIFYPETTDVYDRKNIPRMIYCIHALSLYLFKLGIAPQIQDLLGKVDFTEEEISNMRTELEKYGIQMPSFSKIGGILANELSVDEAALHAAVIAINEAIEKGIAEQTIVTLKNPNAVLTSVDDSLAQNYQKELWEAKKRKEESAKLKNSFISEEERDAYEELLTQAEIQGTINKINRLIAVDHINTVIREGDPGNTLTALMKPEAQLPTVHPFAAVMYQNELFNLQKQNASNYLAHEELSIAVEMLSAVALLNQALEANDLVSVQNHLRNPSIGFNNLDEEYLERYTSTLLSIKSEASSQGQDYLSWNEIQNCIDMVNAEIQEENERDVAIGLINKAIDEKNPEETLKSLQLPAAKFRNLNPDNAYHYQDVLFNAKSEKMKITDHPPLLLRDEIQAAVDYANLDVIKVNKGFITVSKINQYLENEDAENFLEELESSFSEARKIIPLHAKNYYQVLLNAKKQKSYGVTMEGSWIKLTLREIYNFYCNTETGVGTWIYPENYSEKSSWLSDREIKDIMDKMTEDYLYEQMWSISEEMMDNLEETPLMVRVKKEFEERKAFLYEHEPDVVKIQALWRGYKQRKIFAERKKLLADNISSVIKIQSWFRMVSARRRYLARQRYFRTNIDKIVKLQSRIRAFKARVDYKMLVNDKNPPLSVVCKFSYLMDQSDLDLEEELERTRLREQVVTKIRANQQLEKDLNLMDIKIGLLVKNRITLQDVISHRKKMNKKKCQELLRLSGNEKQGIKSLSKEKRKKLEAYQHLFYLLQTNPTYLAKLIFQMPQNKSTKFMDTVIFTLYNYASNQREEYLLLKLFKTALEEEIKSKVDQVQEIVTGNPTVIKMVVSFNRGARGQNTLRQLLAPVVKEIIDDKSLVINTNPVDVYKAWVNQLEMQTGEASKLPYDVTTEQALAHTEVKSKLETSVQNLRRVTDKVLDSIFSSLDQIPYGMRYVAKVLKNSLHKKFPDATEEELLKIVGNLLYYRYMNPAIVAPDGFDIIDMTAGGQIHPDQRRNLGSVAKVLQHAASNKMFEGENAHLSSMNSYLSETYEKFRNFFQEACNVPEPEDKFNIDEYTDMVTVSKPIIYISIEEIINTHSLLLEHQDAIAPEKDDQLNELLEGLGEVPDVESFLGEGAIGPNDPNKENTLNQLLKTEISLSLTSKYDLKGEDIDLKGLMITTKKLVLDVIRTQTGTSLAEVLQTPATPEQELKHSLEMKNRAILDSKTPEEMKNNQSMLEDGQLPLEQKKRKIQRNLRILEQNGLVSSENKYQEVLNEIAKDIRNQRLYRQSRRAELVKLQQTLNALNSKSAFFEDQINYYDTYIKTCLDNLTRKKHTEVI
ncbi:ras GTPase-activating-like protein IQGAP2 [Dromiciops gliroides]|uniref:ras GTPase-activating-like protein IQGAP2 n=1 Tax=Dromiciops gliroides TaxID=33562 RepID=UPI001CC6344E|nr:ras GTPase-activating-like protein IQGAP2 [Dromiciops gliroides]